MNKYLQDRAYQRRDGRNPYGSRGGYVNSQRDNSYNDMAYNKGYDRYNDFRNNNMNDFRDYRSNNRDYDYNNNDFNSFDYAMEEKEYKKDLEMLIEKLKKKDRFNISKEEIIRKARQRGVKFNGYDENEFYATYLMFVSDYKKSILEPNIAITQAQEFLEDDDISVSPSEKFCIYMYKIIMGE